jgi:lipid-binding SYLF domain-containing protein
MHHTLPLSRLLAGLVLCLSAALAHAQVDSAVLQGRMEVREAAQETLSTLYEIQPSARHLVEHAAGYAVFNTIGIKFLLAGGQQGRGVVVNNRTHRQTFMKMLGVQAGLGFGIAQTRLVFVFESASALRAFIDQGWEFGASGAVAAAADSQGAMFTGAFSVTPGVFVFQLTDTGLAAQITATGTKFFKDDALN